MARYAEEAGMELSRIGARIRVTFYEAAYANAGDFSVPLDHIVVTGLREAIKEAGEWMTLDAERNVTMEKSELEDFAHGRIPDAIMRAFPDDSDDELIGVVEVDYADATE